MGNIYMEASQINYRGGEKKMSVEEALKNTSGEAAAIAQLQSDVANLSDVKTNQITIAPTFSAETAYDPGDLVYYNGLSYRCVNAHEGEWDADDFAATTISNELSSLMSGLTGLIAEVVTSEPVAASGSTTVPYPSGFSYGNTAAISVYITDGSVKYVGDEFAKATLTSGGIALNNKMTTAAYVVGVVLAKVG